MKWREKRFYKPGIRLLVFINSIKLVTQSNLNINDIFSFELPIKMNKNEIVSFFRNLRLTNKYNNIHYYFTDLNDGYELHICLEKNNPLKISFATSKEGGSPGLSTL